MLVEKEVKLFILFRYTLMRSCWRLHKDSRPTFKDLIQRLEGMMQTNTDYLDLRPTMVSNASYLQPITRGENFLDRAT